MNKIVAIAAWFTFGAIVLFTLSPIQMRPGDIITPDVDRAMAFFLLSTLFATTFPKRILLIAVLTVMAAGGLELMQHLSPTRHGELSDALFKAAGGLAGAGLAYLISFLRKSGRDTPDAVWNVADQMGPLPNETGFSVMSRMIDSIYFSQEDGQLRIKMHNGEERLFKGVDEAEAIAFVSADSPGRYYTNNIRSKYERVAASPTGQSLVA